MYNQRGFPGDTMERICLPMQETQDTWVGSLGQEDPLEEEMATHSSILAWKILWTEEPGREPQSMGSQTVRHNWATQHIQPKCTSNFNCRLHGRIPHSYHPYVLLQFLSSQECSQTSHSGAVKVCTFSSLVSAPRHISHLDFLPNSNFLSWVLHSILPAFQWLHSALSQTHIFVSRKEKGKFWVQLNHVLI